MGPRAAWRLESLGFEDVYDYVGSKMDWVGAGLPFEGTRAGQPSLQTLAEGDVPTCSLDDTVGDVRARVGDRGFCVVTNHARVVLGLVRAESLGTDDEQRIGGVSREGPKTIRPHLRPVDVLPEIEKMSRPYLLVTNLDGTLVGVVWPQDVRAAQSSSPD